MGTGIQEISNIDINYVLAYPTLSISLGKCSTFRLLACIIPGGIIARLIIYNPNWHLTKPTMRSIIQFVYGM